jgi:hypothetical protein
MRTPLRWKKSSQSGHTGCVEVGRPHLLWRRSSHSDHTNCVEVAATAVRDSKNPGPTLHFPAVNLAAFLKALA